MQSIPRTCQSDFRFVILSVVWWRVWPGRYAIGFTTHWWPSPGWGWYLSLHVSQSLCVCVCIPPPPPPHLVTIHSWPSSGWGWYLALHVSLYVCQYLSLLYVCLYLSLLSVSVSVPQHPPFPPGYYTQVTFTWLGVVPLTACKSVCVYLRPLPPFLPGHYAQVTFTWLGVVPLTACKSVNVCVSVSQSSTTPPPGHCTLARGWGWRYPSLHCM